MYLITGGSRGIGKALAIELSLKGQQVIIVGRSEDKLKKIKQEYNNIEYLALDVTCARDREQIARNTPEKLTALVNNAGIIGNITPITQIKYADWQKTLATNVEPALFLTNLLFKKLIGAKVLNIGSGAAHFPVKGWTNYCVSKAALLMLTKCWQLETQDIAITSVMPGIIDTQMQAIIRDSTCMQEDKLQFFNNLYNERKLLKPQTVAKFLAWLLMEVENKKYCAHEWDIYDTSHHKFWLDEHSSVPSID